MRMEDAFMCCGDDCTSGYCEFSYSSIFHKKYLMLLTLTFLYKNNHWTEICDTLYEILKSVKSSFITVVNGSNSFASNLECFYHCTLLTIIAPINLALKQWSQPHFFQNLMIHCYIDFGTSAMDIFNLHWKWDFIHQKNIYVVTSPISAFHGLYQCVVPWKGAKNLFLSNIKHQQRIIAIHWLHLCDEFEIISTCQKIYFDFSIACIKYLGKVIIINTDLSMRCKNCWWISKIINNHKSGVS
jgi:hypothetical protein